MSFLDIIVIGIGLSMDAFAVSLCKGISLKKMSWLGAVIAGLYFGGFQALMPVIGYLAGSRFYKQIERYDHWIAFILLLTIGVNMIRESFGKDEQTDEGFSWRSMLPLAVATSIDALAVGVTFGFLAVNIAFAAAVIGCTTFLFSAAGVWIGHAFGTRFRASSERVGGIMLILIGARILIEHMFLG